MTPNEIGAKRKSNSPPNDGTRGKRSRSSLQDYDNSNLNSFIEMEYQNGEGDMFMISREAVEAITGTIRDQIESINKTKAAQEIKKQNANVLNDIITKLSNLPATPNVPSKTSKSSELSQLIREVNNLKRIVTRKEMSSSVTKNHDRTCIIEPGNLSFADAVKSIKESGKIEEDKIRINSMFTTKAGKIVIKCKDNSDQQKLLSNCAAADVPLRKMKLKQMKLIVNGLPPEVNELVRTETNGQTNYNDLARALTLQHQKGDEIKQGITIEKLFKAKNDKLSVILNADDNTVDLIKQDAYLYVGLRSYKILPYIDDIQCFNCYQLGDHFAINCKHSGPKCGKCSGSHKYSECNSNEKKCLLCIESDEYMNGAHTHGARDGCCPLKQLFIKRRIEEIWI